MIVLVVKARRDRRAPFGRLNFSSGETNECYDADYRRYAANEIVEICFNQSDELRLAGSCDQSCFDPRAMALSAQKPTSRRTFLQAAGQDPSVNRS